VAPVAGLEIITLFTLDALASMSCGVDNVLLLRDSVPAKVASVPVVGSVTLVGAVAVNVCAKAPAVENTELSAKVKVAPVAGLEITILFTADALASMSCGVDNVLLLRDSVPAKVASMPVVGSVTLVGAVAVNVCAKAPTVENVELSAKVKVAPVAGLEIITLFTFDALASISCGVDNILLVNDSVPANVASVPDVGRVSVVAPVAVNVCE